MYIYNYIYKILTLNIFEHLGTLPFLLGTSMNNGATGAVEVQLGLVDRP